MSNGTREESEVALKKKEEDTVELTPSHTHRLMLLCPEKTNFLFLEMSLWNGSGGTHTEVAGLNSHYREWEDERSMCVELYIQLV